MTFCALSSAKGMDIKMGKEQSYQNAAKEILRLIGGKENVISAAHCATRLRLVLKNEKLADVDGILNTELVYCIVDI